MDEPFAGQLQINGTWTDVPVLVSGGATITGGRQKDAATADPTRCQLTLRNDDASLSSRNPRGPYFGYLGRAVPMRVIVPADENHLWIAKTGDIASTPDTASLDITGDIDIAADIQPLSWVAQNTSGLSIAGKYETTGNQRSWAFYTDPDMYLRFRWSPDGTLTNAITITSTAPIVPAGDGRIAVRVTLDVNNGSGGWTLVFYTGVGGGPITWTQLGASWGGTPTTSIFSSTASLKIGATGVSVDDGTGRYYALLVKNGIGGTTVAYVDFTAATPGATSLTDLTGKTWTLSGPGAEIRDFEVRASGEVANWPVRWNTDGRRKTALVELAGWIRRLNQPSAPLHSPLYREATSATNLQYMIGYWPMEDRAEATSIASGLTGGTAMTIVSTNGTPPLAASTRIPGSDPLPQIIGGLNFTGTPKAHTATGVIVARFVVDVPSGGWLDGAAVCSVRVQGGSVYRWVLEISSLGALRVRGVASDGTQICTSGYFAFAANGNRGMMGFNVTQAGSDVYWQIFFRSINSDLSVIEGGIDGTFTSQTVGKCAQAQLAPDRNLADGTLGHLMIGTSASVAATISGAIVGNAGETAGARILRLGRELGIPVRILGKAADTIPMGPQTSSKSLDLFKECAEADRGLLGEGRDAMVLEYRTRASLYNQVARLTLTYGADGESPDLAPDEPAEDVVNDYTATRTGGSSYEAVENAGRLSALEYPNGVGPRPGGDTVNVRSDGQLPDVAWWETHLGTWDDYRYPLVKVSLDKMVGYGKLELAQSAAAALPGDRLTINSPPSWLPPDPIELQVQGFTEAIMPRRRSISWNAVSHGPWIVGVAGTDLADSDGTTLVSGLSAVTPGTSQSVPVTVVGIPWSTSSNTPFVMWLLTSLGAKAERVTVTAISGTSSPQTFTLTRGLDGYTRAHSAGAALVLFRPLRWAR